MRKIAKDKILKKGNKNVNVVNPFYHHLGTATHMSVKANMYNRWFQEQKRVTNVDRHTHRQVDCETERRKEERNNREIKIQCALVCAL